MGGPEPSAYPCPPCSSRGSPLGHSYSCVTCPGPRCDRPPDRATHRPGAEAGLGVHKKEMPGLSRARGASKSRPGPHPDPRRSRRVARTARALQQVSATSVGDEPPRLVNTADRVVGSRPIQANENRWSAPSADGHQPGGKDRELGGRSSSRGPCGLLRSPREPTGARSGYRGLEAAAPLVHII